MNFSYPMAVIIEDFLTIIGVIITFILPGYIWSYVFFPGFEGPDRNQAIHLTFIERGVLGIILSVVFVTLSIFYLNFLFKIPVETMVILVDVVVLSLAGLLLVCKTDPQIFSRFKNFIRNSIFLRIKTCIKSFIG